MFLEKSITKKINMLYFFDIMGPNIQAKDLMDFLDISQNTLKKYVEEINDKFDDYRILYKDNRLKIETDQRKSGSMISREILEESTNLKLFYQIFRDNQTLSAISEELYISKSTVLKKIKAINEYFKVHNFPISIQSNQTYQIVGDEKIIRKFLQIVLVEMNNYQIYKEYEVLFTEVHHFIEENYPTKDSFYRSVIIDAYLYVSMVRTSKGSYFYPSIKDVPNTISKEVEFIYAYFEKKIPFVNVIERKFNTTFTPLFCANTVNIELLETVDFSRLENGELVGKLSLLVKEYCRTYQISISNYEVYEFILQLCKKIHLIGEFNQVFLKDFEIHFYYLKEINSKKTNYILDKMHAIPLFSKEENSLLYEFIIFFFLNCKKIRSDFFDETVPSQKNILIYSSKQAAVASMIGSIIEDRYTDILNLNIEYANIIYESFSIEKYDLIVSDIYLDAFKNKYLYLGMIPNTEFWTDFEDIILENKTLD